jgi:hypothetical protein
MIALAVLLLSGCQSNDVREAIARQLEMYPESRVQDIYKSFCQDNLGPGHLIPNPESARAYLLSELEEYRNDLAAGKYEIPEVRFIPTGDQGNYVRVDLSVVLDSLADEQTLLDAFVRSANEGSKATEDQWKAKWAEVAKAIRKHFASIPDAESDLAAIDEYLAQGEYILHHSDEFEKAYHPHYRIVARDIFEELEIIAGVNTVYRDVATGVMSSDELRRRYCSEDWNKTEGKVREFDDKYNQGMVGFFDYDYWIQAQDCDNIHISGLAVESRKGNRATVSFLLHNFDSATPMKLELVKEKGEWKIDNFISSGYYPHDLKAEMKEYLNE